MDKLIYRKETYKIRGAIFEVYRELGCGFLEAVYQESLEFELSRQNIPFEAQKIIFIDYKEHQLAQQYIPDFICFEKIIVEIKAVKELTEASKAQVFNYLKITGLKLALLVNFGHYPKVEIKRIVL